MREPSPDEWLCILENFRQEWCKFDHVPEGSTDGGWLWRIAKNCGPVTSAEIEEAAWRAAWRLWD